MFELDWKKVKSAVISGILVSLLAIAGYVISVGDVFTINYHALTNVGIMAILTSMVSLIKSLLTTENGNFVGVVSVK